MIELFTKLMNGTLFHFGDNPERKLIKDGNTHYVSPTGRHQIHPHVAVVPDQSPSQWRDSFYNQSKGESDG